MARKTKEISIEGIADPIQIFELRVKDIYGLFQELTSGENDLTADNLHKLAEKWLPKATNLTIDKMMEMAPSELEQVSETFKEVNGSFFKIAQKLGLTDLLMGVKGAMLNDLNILFADSLSEAMDKPSGATDGASS